MKVNSHKRNSSDYPAILKPLADAPKVMFWSGADPSSWLDKPKVAIVGSRKATAYGREVAESLAGELARAGVVVISGLALGIDSIAHRASLDAGGVTVAVLPTSLDKIYPASHAGLARQIASSGGTLISEYPAGSMPFKVNFMARNRIVSGLADIVLIVEAAKRSGTMSTARFALEQGKTVMAVPGNINSPNSEGTNNLIKSGAIPATDASDIFFALNMQPIAAKTAAFHGNAGEENIMRALKQGTSSQEALALELDLSAQELGSLLTEMEINGYIKPAGNGNWTIA